MSGVPIYRTAISPEWIDYNGHLRDAYYCLILSYASDALMDRLGMDEAYRKRTSYTLYTLEMHVHYLHEVKQTDEVEVSVRILAADHKRIHAAFDFGCARLPDPVATAEVMLLHVHQGDTVRSHAFPAEIEAAIAALTRQTATPSPPGPGSRRMELRSRA